MKNKGFTLIELSIVLIIISLVVGGIVGGQSLIKSAKLNKLISELKTWETAFNNFDLQYDALPGDIRNASQYWPTYTPPGGKIMDGDGDGQIESRNDEKHVSTYHLQLAELIFPTYEASGVYALSGYNANNVMTVHTSIVIGNVVVGGFDVNPSGSNVVNLNYFDSATFIGDLATLIPKDMQSLDKKLDDGLPSTGKVIARGTVVPSLPPPPGWGCILVGNKYNLPNEDKGCNLSYIVR